mgnify:CR=1 FL=1
MRRDIPPSPIVAFFLAPDYTYPLLKKWPIWAKVLIFLSGTLSLSIFFVNMLYGHSWGTPDSPSARQLILSMGIIAGSFSVVGAIHTAIFKSITHWLRVTLPVRHIPGLIIITTYLYLTIFLPFNAAVTALQIASLRMAAGIIQLIAVFTCFALPLGLYAQTQILESNYRRAPLRCFGAGLLTALAMILFCAALFILAWKLKTNS